MTDYLIAGLIGLPFFAMGVVLAGGIIGGLLDWVGLIEYPKRTHTLECAQSGRKCKGECVEHDGFSNFR